MDRKTVEKLIRTAHADPSRRDQILAQLQEAGLDKLAIAGETEDFVEWALNQPKPMSPNEVERFVNQTLQIKTSPPRTTRSGPRFQKGDRVEIIASKHKDAGTVAVYKEFDGKIGTVVGTDKDDVLVQFDRGPREPVRIPNGLKARGVGIYKYAEPYTIEGSAKIEMIYKAGGEPTKDQIIQVQHYLGKGKKTERRSAQFYSGHVVSASTNKSGAFYFLAFPQQRLRVDPKAESGFRPRTFNPSKGDVFYIGLVGKRPAGWKEELAEMRADAEPSEE